MNRIIVATAFTIATLSGSGAAFAAAPCSIIGTFKDTLGTTGSFKTEKKGVAMNTTVCSVPYNLTVTKLTNVILNIKGRPQSGSCGALVGKFKFQNGGCLSAAGTITITGLGTFNDTVTHTGNIVQSPTTNLSSMTSGLN